MSMSQATAERWVTISAVTVAGIYTYRRLVEPSTPPATVKKLMGVGELPPLGSWATAWGFTFLVVSVMAEASPGLGGGFAILIMTADILTNSASLFADVGKQQKTPAGVPSGAQVLAATDPLSGLAAAPATVAATIGPFSTAPASVQTRGVNPAAPIYIPPVG
jgi:hypothetical protein